MDDEKKTPTPPEMLGSNVSAGVGAGYDKDSIARARLAEAEAWRRENPRLWALMESWALAEVDGGRRFSVRELVERLRWHSASLTDKGGKSPRVDNYLAVVGARWLAREHPRCRPYLVMRRSAVDGVMAEGEC